MLHWLKNKLSPRDTTGFTIENLPGSGTLHCNACGHTEQVHGFTHGFGPTSSCTMGYQCQSCAKFVTFDSEPVGGKGMKALEKKVRKARCECGGRYARDKPIMCPRCKSVSVGYDLDYIT